MIRVAMNLCAVSVTILLLAGHPTMAQKAYDPGVTDREIRIGNTQAYSGPASAYSLIAKTEAAYFQMVNDQGGVNGRRINYISYDDAYNPAKTVEQIRKLVERDEVLLTFSGLGTLTQSAVQKYLNARKVPQLFVSSGSGKWNDPKTFPWTMGFQASYRSTARVFAKFILAQKPDAKIAILHAADDFGKEYLQGLRDVFGDAASRLIVMEASYENSEPTIDSHIVRMKSSGANVFVNISTPKFTAQAIKKAHELGWKPLHLIADVSISVGSVMQPAGLEASEGVYSAGYRKDPSDPSWDNDPGTQKFKAFVDKYMPGSNIADSNVVYGYMSAQTLVHVLETCGDDLTRANVMKQAANIDGFTPDLLLPGIRAKTSPDDFAPLEQLQMMQFKNGRWTFIGEVISAEKRK